MCVFAVKEGGKDPRTFGTDSDTCFSPVDNSSHLLPLPSFLFSRQISDALTTINTAGLSLVLRILISALHFTLP
jgi:hypothetical protein